jgi:dihydrofolate reductase
MRLNQIVACAANRTIGRQGQLPWHIRGDLQHFKRETRGHPIIMGRKTFDSIGKALPGRLNVVITRQAEWPAPNGVIVAHSVPEALAYCETHQGEWGSELFVIGGSQLYSETLPFTDRILLTQILQPVEGDCTYPELAMSEFKRTAASDVHQDGPWSYQFETWERIATDQGLRLQAEKA